MIKKYRIWIECEKEIEANSLDEAIQNFTENFDVGEMDFNGMELN